MGLSSQALELIDRVYLSVLTHGSLWDQGRTLLLKSLCIISQSKLSTKDKPVKIRRAVDLLKESLSIFTKCKANQKLKYIYYLQVNPLQSTHFILKH